MSINKIVYGNNTLIDLTEDSVSPETLLEGITAHNAKGEKITGVAVIGGDTSGESIPKYEYQGEDGFEVVFEQRLPEEYQEVEYLEGEGSQYINTGYVPTKDTVIEIGYEFTSFPTSSSYYYVFGDYKKAATNSTRLMTSSGSNNTVVNMFTSADRNNFTISGKKSLNTKYDDILSNTSYTSNGVTKTITNTGTGSANTNNLVLFANYAGGRKSYLKIYYFKLKENDVTLMELVPCYRKSDDVNGMYDLISGDFLTNPGTSNFLRGSNVDSFIVSTEEIELALVNPSGGTLLTEGTCFDKNLVIVPKLQEKTVMPSGVSQEIEPDDGYAGLGKVVVEAVEIEVAGAIQPQKVLNITENGTYTLNPDGEYDAIGQGVINVNVPNSGSGTDMLQQRVNANGCKYLFYNYEGSSVSYISNLDTSKVKNMYYMFRGCINITTVPMINTSNATNLDSMFAECVKLTAAYLSDTSKGQVFRSMFYGCTNLTTVHSLDFRECLSSPSSIFTNCTNLTNITLLNIDNAIQIGSGTTWGHLLTLESLLNTCKECISSNLSRTLTMGSANLEKLASVYVKPITITDEMRAEDEFIDDKVPFEVVDASTEGAITITDYMLDKGWTLA